MARQPERRLRLIFHPYSSVYNRDRPGIRSYLDLHIKFLSDVHTPNFASKISSTLDHLFDLRLHTGEEVSRSHLRAPTNCP